MIFCANAGITIMLLIPLTSKVQNITSVPKYDLFSRMYVLFYCTYLNKKGSSTVVWIIYPKVYFYKKLRYVQNFDFFLVRLLERYVIVTIYKQYTKTTNLDTIPLGL